MALYKRNQTYWTDFAVNGQRFRMSLDTTDWREAQRLQKEKIAEAQQGRLSAVGQQFARLAFSDAAGRYLDGRKPELSEASLRKERQLLVQPWTFFGATSVGKLDVEAILQYRDWRSDEGLKASYLNMELGVIRRILKRAKRWHVVADEIRPLKETRKIGRALTPLQRTQLLETAMGKPEWQAAYCAAVLAGCGKIVSGERFFTLVALFCQS